MTTTKTKPIGPIWITKTGEQIPIKSMDTDHIRHARALCHRAYEQARDKAEAAFIYSGSDIAEYYADQAADEWSAKARKWADWIGNFDRELKRRGASR